MKKIYLAFSLSFAAVAVNAQNNLVAANTNATVKTTPVPAAFTGLYLGRPV